MASSILKNVGTATLRRLGKTTNNSCLKRVYCLLAKKDGETGDQLDGLSSCDAKKGADIVCKLLDYKAQQYRSCLSCN